MKKAIRLLFFVYCIWMLWLLFGQRFGSYDGQSYAQVLEQNLNLIPFRTVRRYTYVLRYLSDPVMIRQAAVNLAGNICLFIPLGFLLPCTVMGLRKFFPLLGFSLCLILAVEILQFVTFLGCCDIDDLILNIAGILLGFCLWKLAERYLAEKQ